MSGRAVVGRRLVDVCFVGDAVCVVVTRDGAEQGVGFARTRGSVGDQGAVIALTQVLGKVLILDCVAVHLFLRDVGIPHLHVL